MRIVAKGNKVSVKLEDKTSGELFAQAPIDAYPGVAVESVTDSSRYFVLKIADDNGRTAFIGIGFADRGDAFDFNVTLQDHFNSVKKDKEIEQNMNSQPALDLQLKEGQTFKINLSGKLGSKAQSRPRTNATPGTGGLLLPPPPGASSRPQVPAPTQQQTAAPASVDLLGLGATHQAPAPAAQSTNPFPTSEWGDFASARQPAPGAATNADDGGWVQF